MRIAPMLILVCLLLTACGRSDTKLSERISGSWHQNPIRMVFNPDGRFTLTIRQDAHANDYAGAWRIKDGFLDLVLTNKSAVDTRGEIGERGHFKIIDLDAHHLSYIQNGLTNSMSR
jgi:hypothetical protein